VKSLRKSSVDAPVLGLTGAVECFDDDIAERFDDMEYEVV
jgi:hypothetical protein